LRESQHLGKKLGTAFSLANVSPVRNRSRTLRRAGIGIAVVTVLVCVLCLGAAAELKAAGFQTNSMEGWEVLVSEKLLAEDKAATEKALELLRVQLQEIVRVVPAPALARLREVTLWFSPEYPGVRSRAEYHPGADWLRENGRNEAMVKGVEFTNVRDFEAETKRMPNFTLHELAHAYHDQVLAGGFENAEIQAAYDRAKNSGAYDKVEHWFGSGRSNTLERAYALSNLMEFFAESTEAFFSRNDFFPFTRDELKRHDPETEQMLGSLWGTNESRDRAETPAGPKLP
jgi:hypothetical protein